MPFQRLYFFAIAQSIITKVQEIADQMWSSSDFLVNVKPEA